MCLFSLRASLASRIGCQAPGRSSCLDGEAASPHQQHNDRLWHEPPTVTDIVDVVPRVWARRIATQGVFMPSVHCTIHANAHAHAAERTRHQRPRATTHRHAELNSLVSSWRESERDQTLHRYSILTRRGTKCVRKSSARVGSGGSVRGARTGARRADGTGVRTTHPGRDSGRETRRATRDGRDTRRHAPALCALPTCSIGKNITVRLFQTPRYAFERPGQPPGMLCVLMPWTPCPPWAWTPWAAHTWRSWPSACTSWRACQRAASRGRCI